MPTLQRGTAVLICIESQKGRKRPSKLWVDPRTDSQWQWSWQWNNMNIPFLPLNALQMLFSGQWKWKHASNFSDSICWFKVHYTRSEKKDCLFGRKDESFSSEKHRTAEELPDLLLTDQVTAWRIDSTCKTWKFDFYIYVQMECKKKSCSI